MLKLRQFDLQLAFLRAGALREDIEDQRGAVENLAIEDVFQVAALRGGKFVVENDGVHVVPLAIRGEFVRLAAADERGGIGRFQFLRAVPTTSPPAVVASSASSSRESRVSGALRDLSSTPTRKTRSVRLVEVEINAFNRVRLPF